MRKVIRTSSAYSVWVLIDGEWRRNTWPPIGVEHAEAMQKFDRLKAEGYRVQLTRVDICETVVLDSIPQS